MKLRQRANIGGLFIAISGFTITRLFVAEAISADINVAFLIAGVGPLLLGLGLTVYGVALAVGPFTNRYVNTIAVWHFLGISAMVFIVAVTATEQLIHSGQIGIINDSSLLVSNVILGGAVGGTLTGIRSGKIRRQRRELRGSVNRSLLVNRMLRHEILNSATIVDGHANLLASTDGERDRSLSAIQRAVERINQTITEIGTIAGPTKQSQSANVESLARSVIEELRTAHDVDIELMADVEDETVSADDRLGIVIDELIENAVIHSGSGLIRVLLNEDPNGVALTIEDRGPGLSATQQALLEDGEFPEFDDPSAGFGHKFARLLVIQFGGDIRVEDRSDQDGGTRITLLLPRAHGRELSMQMLGMTYPNLTWAIVAGLLGGITMGAFYQLSTGLLPVIGSLYGIENQLIGWITHLFHSIVFGLLFAALLAMSEVSAMSRHPLNAGVLGLGWGMVLWLVAAGVIMPLWLLALGFDATVPNLELHGFIGHALWGIVVGIAYTKLSEFGSLKNRVTGFWR